MLRRTARSAAAALAGMAVFVAACGPGASGSIPQADCGRPFSPRIQHGLRDVALVVRRTYHIPGIAVAVTVPGEGCWVGASGLADIARRLPLTAQDAVAAVPRLVVHGYDAALGQVADITRVYEAPARLSVAGAAYAMTSTVGDLQVWARALATGSLLSAAVQGQRLRLIHASGLGSFRPLPGTPGPARVAQIVVPGGLR